MSAAMKGKPPARDIQITLTISETTEGKLNIMGNIPSAAEGTIALLLADAALKVMQGMMRDVGIPPETQGRVQ